LGSLTLFVGVQLTGWCITLSYVTKGEWVYAVNVRKCAFNLHTY
jgi:hypothetical protein